MKIFNKYWWRKCLDVPNFFRKIKWFIQRGRRGYADSDCWGVDYYLIDIIPKMISTLKDSIGVPTYYFTKPGEKHSEYDWKVARRRRNKDLDKIINTFTIADKILNDNYIYCPTKEYYKKTNKDLRKRYDKFLTYQECKEYENGWKIFQDLFFTLWN